MQAATGARCCFFTLQEGQDVGCTMCGAGVTEQDLRLVDVAFLHRA